MVSPFFFFFNVPPTTEIYTLSLHDALPIFNPAIARRAAAGLHHSPIGLLQPFRIDADYAWRCPRPQGPAPARLRDRKSTRLNSSHVRISYAVFCLKKKNTYILTPITHHSLH